MKKIIFLVLGVAFGIIMYKGEAASWFRIYEMFNFQSFHMYGIIGSALILGIIVIQLIKRSGMKDLDGEPILIPDKDKQFKKYLIGGIFFGLGWAMAGACPGPLFVLAGAGYLPILVVIGGAIAGTWLYGALRDKLPH